MPNRLYNRLTISQKLTFSYFTTGVLSLVIVSFIFYYAFRDALLERTISQLSSINILKKIQVEDLIVESRRISNSTYSPEDIERIDYILKERTGMGESGETYLVDNTHKMITKSRFFPTNKSILITTPIVEKAFKNEEAYGIIPDYRGIEVISYCRRIKHENDSWVIVSEIDLEEATKPAEKVKNYIIGVVMVFVLLITYFTLILSSKIANPIVQLKKIIEELSLGKISEEKVSYTNKDEIGDMAVAIRKLLEGIQRTTVFALETGQGNFEAKFQPLSDDDALGNTLILMRDRIVELQEKKLSLARQRSAAIIEGQEKEQQRLARELHDGLGQLLTGIRFKIEALNCDVKDKEAIKVLLDETIVEVRRISHNAMPASLTDFGLESALRAVCNKVANFGTIHIEYDFVLEEEAMKTLGFDISTTLYRIAQEALTNILKHAQATKALVEVYKEENFIVMEISDNGKGFEWEEKFGTGNGLKNIQERANLCQGFTKISSELGKGTKLIVSIPLN